MATWPTSDVGLQNPKGPPNGHEGVLEWGKTKSTSCLELLISDKFVDNTFASISTLHALLNTFMPTFHAKCTMWKSEGAQNGQYHPHGTTPFKRLCSMPGLPKWSNGWPRVMPRTMVLWNGDALPQSFAFFYLAFAILAIFRPLLGLTSFIINCGCPSDMTSRR